ncbi:MAG TPA: extracellular solute-binding protein [Candidatus Methylomirabilis sp.]|nr:extracellular solute-binding protein [Candidatus Methylomirabilis sp.]
MKPGTGLSLAALGIVLVLAVCIRGFAQTPARPAAPKSWEETVAAGRKEGVVVVSFFGAPGAATDRQAAEFERLYGIRVQLLPARTGDFEARWNAERAAGKPSIDLRASGSPENRRLAARGLDQDFGTLPAAAEPGVQWIVDPLVDVKAGNGHTLHVSAGGYFLLVNNKLVPPEMGPRSYKDLEDPKYKGLILLSEPIGPSPGSRWAAYAWKAYGDEHLKKVIANVKALTRAEIDAPKQIARGEYGIFVHPTQVGAADIWKLPKPHTFRLVVPEDGVMLLTGGISLLQGAPHPDAARMYMNYLLTRSAQQIAADDAGGPFVRRDVKPLVPELAHFATAKPFPNNPDTYEFGSKLFFEWSAKAEPYLKAAGLK